MDKDKQTASHAASHNRIEAAKVLIQNGVDVNAIGEWDVDNKMTPFYIAAHEGHANFAEVLIQAGVKMNIGNNFNIFPFTPQLIMTIFML